MLEIDGVSTTTTIAAEVAAAPQEDQQAQAPGPVAVSLPGEDKGKKKKDKPKSGQHIFNNDRVEIEARRWKALVAEGRTEEADKLIEEIIPQCKNLFSRFAQFEKFDDKVELGSLINEAMIKVPHWINYWDPVKGTLFTYMSVCSKRLWVGLSKKESEYKGRYYATGDNLEKFAGMEDHEVAKHDSAKELRDRLNDITVRWASKQSKGAIKMYIDVLISGDYINKKYLQRTASYAYCISPELAKFYYSWTLVAMRDIMYDKLRVNYTDQDLFRLGHSYSFLPDLLTVISWQQMVKVMALFGGHRVKIPTLESLQKTRKEFSLHRDLDNAQTPEEFTRNARKHGFTERSAHEVYERMSATLNHEHDTEHGLFEDDFT